MDNVRFVTIGKFEALTGYTEKATRSKIEQAVWLQDREFVKAPDGRILMYLPGYEAWAQGKPGSAPPLMGR